MDYEKFLKTIKELDIYIESDSFLNKHNKKQNFLFCIKGESCIGGTTGGSCWYDGEEDPHYGYTNSSGFSKCDNELKSQLNIILTTICPNMTFLQYDNLIRDLIKEKEYTNYEYYGNSSDHLIRYIILKDLYNKLVELKLHE